MPLHPWARALSTLQAVCSTSGRTLSRALSAAAGPPIEGAVAAEGAKSKLHRLLEGAKRPLTSAEMWELAGEEGLKSKRFMKQMLQQMKRGGHIRAVQTLGMGKKHKSFAFVLPGLRNQHQQEQQ